MRELRLPRYHMFFASRMYCTAVLLAWEHFLLAHHISEMIVRSIGGEGTSGLLSQGDIMADLVTQSSQSLLGHVPRGDGIPSDVVIPATVG